MADAEGSTKTVDFGGGGGSAAWGPRLPEPRRAEASHGDTVIERAETDPLPALGGVDGQHRHLHLSLAALAPSIPEKMKHLMDLVESSEKVSVLKYQILLWKASAQEWTEQHRAAIYAKLESTRGRAAVLLPEGEALQLLHVRTRASADVSFCGSPRRLYIVELGGKNIGYPMHVQLQLLHQIVGNATQARKAHSGPWIWPLHDDAVSLAVMSANTILAEHRLSWWRRFLWGTRLFPLPGGCQKEGLLQKCYGSAVAYVFAWSNFYVQGLWSLAVVLLVLNAAGVASGAGWSVMQFLTLLWCTLVTEFGHSKRHIQVAGGVRSGSKVLRSRSSVLRSMWEHCCATSSASSSGGSGADSAAAGEAAAATATTAAAAAASASAQSLSSDSVGHNPSEDLHRGFARSELRADRAEALRRERERGTSSSAPSRRRQGLGGASEAGAEVEDEASKILASAAERVAEAIGAAEAEEAAAAERRRTVRARWRSAVDAALLSVMPARLEQQHNWRFKPMSDEDLRRRRIITLCGGMILVGLFVWVCILVLGGFVHLNMYIAFVWGRCLDPEVKERAAAMGTFCRDPQFVHGFVGWLAEVGSDIALAILFDVALGAIAQAIAGKLVGLWNYRTDFNRRYAICMLSLSVEVMSKVGMYAVVAFVFLPCWVPVLPGPFVAAKECSTLLDYRMCRAVSQCDPVRDPSCCSGMLTCLAQQLDYDDRRMLFEKSVKGPFVVGPFVRIIITVLVPWLAGWLESCVTVDARDDDPEAPAGGGGEAGAAPPSDIEAPGDSTSGRRGPRRCAAGCLSCLRTVTTPVLRILALIFHLDGDGAGGCGYLTRGWPFEGLSPLSAASEDVHKSRVILNRALDQVVRKKFEPLDELIELKLSFLFVSFFAPIMPTGVAPTLIARILEVRSKATKLLFVRQRAWPASAELLHATQDTFTRCVSVFAVLWHVGLVVVSFNKNVGQWHWHEILLVWLAGAVGVLAVLRATCFVAGWLSDHLLRRRDSSDADAGSTGKAGKRPSEAKPDFNEAPIREGNIKVQL